MNYNRGITVRIISTAILAFILLFAMFSTIGLVQAQDGAESVEGGAEINANINGDIPSIQVTRWTEIDITIRDAFGIDWAMLEENVPRFVMEILWPLNPGFPQPVKRFLGPTSFKLEPEIIQGNSDGWYVKVTPTKLDDSIRGDSHNVTLEVQVDDSSIDNSVVVGIKCTRIDTLGGEIGYSYIYIPVKASPTNFIRMDALENSMKETGPKSMVYFTLDIMNEGYYKDVFEFEIEEENGLMGLMSQQAVTILPGETTRVNLGILTPEKLFDPGTPNKINVYVRSTGNTTKTLIGSLIVVTKGFYISPLAGIIAAPVIIILVGAYVFFKYYKDKQERFLYGKPNKPWKIPAEKKYLQNLKENNPEKRHEVLLMMQDEYKSALLWYYDTLKNNQNVKAGSNSTSTGFFKNITHSTSKEKKALDDKKEETNAAKKPKISKKKTKREEKKPSKEKTDVSSETIPRGRKSASARISGFFSTFKKIKEKDKESSKEEKDEGKKVETKPKPLVDKNVEPESKPVEKPKINEKTMAKQQEKQEKSWRKQKTLSKLKRAQEKQRKKFRNKVSWIKKTQ